MKYVRSRKKKENHVEVMITGENSGEIGKVIQAALRRTEYRQKVSFQIIMMDSPQWD